MPRYALLLEYDGTPYVGWQYQDNGPSVQGRLSQAIAAFCGEEVMPVGAGRTDAGVHALGQWAHVDLTKNWSPETVRDAVNAHLRPDPIAVLACRRVSPDFHARFSATKRHYLYRIVNRRAPLALARHRAWHVPRPLDAAAMAAAASHVEGRHDFTTFRATQCQAASPVKTLDRLRVTRQGEEIHIEAEARSFLHNQVRSLVGSLKLVGEGRWPPERMAEALAARNRSACGPVAPACGLYLVKVRYPEDAEAMA